MPVTLMRGGNIGVTNTSLHPNGNAYVLLKRDIPGSAIILAEQDWNGAFTRIIKVWANRYDYSKIISTIKAEERAANRTQDFATEQVEKPISSPSCVCRQDGSILINHTFGGGDGLCDWQVEIIPNACQPWTPQGSWPLTVSATDTVARQAAQSARDRADAAARMADSASGVADTAKSKAEVAQKAAQGATLDAGKVLQIVSDDIAAGLKKDEKGNRGGRLIHVLWQFGLQVIPDVLAALKR